MIAVTKTYRKNGSFSESIGDIYYGKVSPSSGKDPSIISLEVRGVNAISSISLEVAYSNTVSVDSGFIEYYNSKSIIVDFSKIVKKQLLVGQKIHLRNISDTKSEYLYIWLNQDKAYGRDIEVGFKWNFDYVEPSSSSSSSSSCTFGDFIEVGPNKAVKVYAQDCEYVYFRFSLSNAQYTTVLFGWEPIPIENNGGTLVIFDESFIDDGDTKRLVVDDEEYVIELLDASSSIVRIHRAGDCSPFDHLVLTNGYDFLLETGGRVLLLGDGYRIREWLLKTDGGDFLLENGGKLILLSASGSSSSSSSCSSSSSSFSSSSSSSSENTP